MCMHYSNAFLLHIDCSCVDANMTENMAAMLKTLEVLLTTYDVTSLPLEGN